MKNILKPITVMAAAVVMTSCGGSKEPVQTPAEALLDVFYLKNRHLPSLLNGNS